MGSRSAPSERVLQVALYRKSDSAFSYQLPAASRRCTCGYPCAFVRKRRSSRYPYQSGQQFRSPGVQEEGTAMVSRKLVLSLCCLVLLVVTTPLIGAGSTENKSMRITFSQPVRLP